MDSDRLNRGWSMGSEQCLRGGQQVGRAVSKSEAEGR
jgi:hypothetical protein